MGCKRLITAVFHPISFPAWERNAVEPQRKAAKGDSVFPLWNPLETAKRKMDFPLGFLFLCHQRQNMPAALGTLWLGHLCRCMCINLSDYLS